VLDPLNGPPPLFFGRSLSSFPPRADLGLLLRSEARGLPLVFPLARRLFLLLSSPLPFSLLGIQPRVGRLVLIEILDLVGLDLWDPTASATALADTSRGGADPGDRPA
jgi:hypothetical protein